MRNHDTSESNSPFTRPPFLYEIRVQGRLSSEQWTSWFDDLTVSTTQGETTLWGRAADQAALHGVLGRLRDLAIPLIAVKVLDAEAQKTLSQQSRRYDLMINLSLIGIYLLLMGALSALTVFVAPIINTALALSLLFALLGLSAHALWLWSGQLAWRWVAYGIWVAAAITFLIFIPISDVLPTTVGIALMLLLGAGGMLYLVYALRRHAEDVRGWLAGGPWAAGRVDSGQVEPTAEAMAGDRRSDA